MQHDQEQMSELEIRYRKLADMNMITQDEVNKDLCKAGKEYLDQSFSSISGYEDI